VPAGIYLSQYNDSDTQQIAYFEEDLNLETATLPGGRLKGVNLATWREEPPPLKWDGRDSEISSPASQGYPFNGGQFLNGLIS
jgi:hypothetical protein